MGGVGGGRPGLPGRFRRPAGGVPARPAAGLLRRWGVLQHPGVSRRPPHRHRAARVLGLVGCRVMAARVRRCGSRAGGWSCPDQLPHPSVRNVPVAVGSR